MNEYFTSKRCPECEGFVCKTEEWRWLYCPTCKRNWQRDVMAAKDMCRAVNEHLRKRSRLRYLQPQRKDGSFPWMEADDVATVSIDPPAQTRSSGGDTSSTTPKRLVGEIEGSKPPQPPATRRRRTSTGTTSRSIDSSEPPANPTPQGRRASRK